MIRRSPIKRAGIARTGNKYGAVRTACAQGHYHASKIESAWCAALVLMERGKAIRNLRQQITHTLYLMALPDLQRSVNGTHLMGWCSCFGLKHQPAPSGYERFRLIRPDFEFEEQVKGDWFTVTADAKGCEQEAQMLAYKVFELVHGREIRLYKKHP